VCCPGQCCRAQAQNNEATLAETLQKTTSQVSSELVELCCENHALSCENHELMQVRRLGRGGALRQGCGTRRQQLLSLQQQQQQQV
jgi:regulator of replication initiation timing